MKNASDELYRCIHGMSLREIDKIADAACSLCREHKKVGFTEGIKIGIRLEQEKDLGTQVMDFFARLGQLRPCEPDSEAAQSWASQLQAFFTEHFYTCTPQILKSLAESYAGGGSMTENIDKAGGAGTGAFAKQVIDAYIESL